MFIGSTSGLAISFTIQDLWSVGLLIITFCFSHH